jgi:hypothetical protein
VQRSRSKESSSGASTVAKAKSPMLIRYSSVMFCPQPVDAIGYGLIKAELVVEA